MLDVAAMGGGKWVRSSRSGRSPVAEKVGEGESTLETERSSRSCCMKAPETETESKSLRDRDS